MSGSTGSRCAIYERIDALDEARTVADLLRRLKPILNELAYYAVTGEAAVMETREEWHSQYTDALYGETSSDHKAGRAAAAGRAGPAARGDGTRSERSERSERAPLPPPTNRPRPEDLPASLRAIMNGSHSSFG